MAAEQTTLDFCPQRHSSSKSITATVYGMIKNRKLKEALEFLEGLLLNGTSKNNWAMLSLLGYLFYHTQDYPKAAECYRQLCATQPKHLQYRLFYAQALQRCSRSDVATKVCRGIGSNKLKNKALFLQSCIAYEKKEYAESRSYLDMCPQELLEVKVNYACILYQEGNYFEARKMFTEVDFAQSKDPRIMYSIAVCNYRLGHIVQALKILSVIIDRANRKHPELNIGMTTEGVTVASVGNPGVLQETAIIEAFNLKAAMEFSMQNHEGARDALTDMPPRLESELDHYTLHNTALIHMTMVDLSEERVSRVVGGFNKLQFLLEQPDFPDETLANLLLLFIKFEHFDLAADILASHYILRETHLSELMKTFLDAVLIIPKSPKEAYVKLEALAKAQEDKLRQVIEKKVAKPGQAFEDQLEIYVAILMQQAKILWDREKYKEVERLFHQSYLLCKNHRIWKLNSAHVLFVQGSKYKQAAELYESIVQNHYHEILKIPAAVLANLCVSYVMTSRNEIAEDLMRKVEKEEEKLAFDNPEKKMYHLSIINIVIGTLYCSKGNYEFGIGRIMKGMVPLSKKLGTETWYYIKRCFMALFETMAHQLIQISDSIVLECLDFLTKCEDMGINIKAREEGPMEIPRHKGLNTVTYEARILKALLIQLMPN